jgi:hypothetical protein
VATKDSCIGVATKNSKISILMPGPLPKKIVQKLTDKVNIGPTFGALLNSQSTKLFGLPQPNIVEKINAKWVTYS